MPHPLLLLLGAPRQHLVHHHHLLLLPLLHCLESLHPLIQVNQQIYCAANCPSHP
jgi:hypothetical protein